RQSLRTFHCGTDTYWLERYLLRLYPKVRAPPTPSNSGTTASIQHSQLATHYSHLATHYSKLRIVTRSSYPEQFFRCVRSIPSADGLCSLRQKEMSRRLQV